MTTEVDATGISIEVSGPPDSGKTLVCSVIHQALTKSGFVDVTLIDQEDKEIEPGEVKTMLDMVQQTRPELFATPIFINEVTDIDTVEDDITTIELSDVTLHVDPVADLGFADELAPDFQE